MRRLADQRDTVARQRARGLDRERKQPAPRLDCHLAEQRMRAAFDLDGKLRVRHGEQRRRARRVEHADKARSPAGQGNEREWSMLGVEFRRRIVMRPGVREIERQRGLRIGAAIGADPGRGAAQRMLPVGADDKPRALTCGRQA